MKTPTRTRRTRRRRAARRRTRTTPRRRRTWRRRTTGRRRTAAAATWRRRRRKRTRRRREKRSGTRRPNERNPAPSVAADRGPETAGTLQTAGERTERSPEEAGKGRALAWIPPEGTAPSAPREWRMAGGRIKRAEGRPNPLNSADPEKGVDLNLNPSPDRSPRRGPSPSWNLKRKENQSRDQSRLKGAGPNHDLNPKKLEDRQGQMTLVVVLDQGKPLRGDDLAPDRLRGDHYRDRIVLLTDGGSEMTGWTFCFSVCVLFKSCKLWSWLHVHRGTHTHMHICMHTHTRTITCTQTGRSNLSQSLYWHFYWHFILSHISKLRFESCKRKPFIPVM